MALHRVWPSKHLSKNSVSHTTICRVTSTRTWIFVNKLFASTNTMRWFWKSWACCLFGATLQPWCRMRWIEAALRQSDIARHSNLVIPQVHSWWCYAVLLPSVIFYNFPPVPLQSWKGHLGQITQSPHWVGHNGGVTGQCCRAACGLGLISAFCVRPWFCRGLILRLRLNCNTSLSCWQLHSR